MLWLVDDPLLTVFAHMFLGKGARTMEVEVWYEVFPVEPIDSRRPHSGDVEVPHVLPNCGAILAFDEAVVVTVTRTALRLAYEELVEER